MGDKRNSRVIIKGGNKSYSFAEHRLYFAEKTNRREDGNTVIKTDELIRLGNKEFNKFSVQETSLFDPELICGELVKLTQCADVRLVSQINPHLKRTREIYLDKAKCRVLVAEIGASDRQKKRRLICELLSYQHEHHTFCPICFALQKCGSICGKCENRGTRIVRVYCLEGSGKETLFGMFLSGDIARLAIEAFVRYELRRRENAKDVRSTRLSFGGNKSTGGGWRFEFLPRRAHQSLHLNDKNLVRRGK